MEIVALCEKLSTCSGQWTSPPIGDSRWNNFGSCGNWMEPEGRNSGNTFMNFRNGQHPNISNKGFMIVQLLFRELLFSWHRDWFLFLIFIYLFISGLIFWDFLEFWMPLSFLTRLEITIELMIEPWKLMTKFRKINVQLISNYSALLWHSYFTDIETKALNEKKTV